MKKNIRAFSEIQLSNALQKTQILSSSNQKGSVMFIVLLILTLITMIGLTMSKTTFFEMQISSFHTIYKQNFAQADGAIREMSQNVAIIPDLSGAPPAWLLPISTPLLPAVNDAAGLTNEVQNVRNDATWTGAGNSTVSAAFPQARTIAVHRGIAPGSSLALGSQRIHVFDLYGRSQQNNGEVIIKTVYRDSY